jgi:type VI secretion system secreted protein VgrG
MRIFHNRTVVQIVREVLGAHAGLGNPHLEVKVTSEYPLLEYTVQYAESDADFVRRQLERFGISLSWRHAVKSHTLLLSDEASALPAVAGDVRPYYGVSGYDRGNEDYFRLWSQAQRITTGAVRLTEYNFKMPNAAQDVDKLGDAAHPQGDVESYNWPGNCLDQNEGRGVVNRRLDAERGQGQ